MTARLDEVAWARIEIGLVALGVAQLLMPLAARLTWRRFAQRGDDGLADFGGAE